MESPFISIIIPFQRVNEYVLECVHHCDALDYDNLEIILLPDEAVEAADFPNPLVRIIPTGSIKPALKRNIGIKEAKGDIIAFLDSDAYPIREWLSEALPYFGDDMVGGIGGPNFTPEADSILQKVSGDIFSSPVGAGKFAARYTARYLFRKGLPVKEMPSCNLLVRKDVAEQAGGFDGTLLTGEDAKFCFEIRKLGKKIVYAPEVQVHHHRRGLFGPHLRQVWVYGRDKAWVVKEDFSPDKLYYFIPIAFVTSLVTGGVLSLFSQHVRSIYLLGVAVYLGIVLVGSLVQSPARSFLIFPGIVLTHISYGLGSLYGLLTEREKQG